MNRDSTQCSGKLGRDSPFRYGSHTTSPPETAAALLHSITIARSTRLRLWLLASPYPLPGVVIGPTIDIARGSAAGQFKRSETGIGLSGDHFKSEVFPTQRIGPARDDIFCDIPIHIYDRYEVSRTWRHSHSNSREELALESKALAKELGISRTEFIRRALRHEVQAIKARLEREAMAEALKAMREDPVYLEESEEIQAGLNECLPSEEDRWWQAQS